MSDHPDDKHVPPAFVFVRDPEVRQMFDSGGITVELLEDRKRFSAWLRWSFSNYDAEIQTRVTRGKYVLAFFIAITGAVLTWTLTYGTPVFLTWIRGH